MESDALQATIIDGRVAKAVGVHASVDMSRANINFVVGDRPMFADETAGVLCSRLRAASITITVILGAAFLSSVVSGTDSFWLLRVGILLVVTVSWNVLRSQR